MLGLKAGEKFDFNALLCLIIIIDSRHYFIYVNSLYTHCVEGNGVFTTWKCLMCVEKQCNRVIISFIYSNSDSHAYMAIRWVLA